MKRLVSVWLPDWPVTVWMGKAGRPPPPEGAPFALVERTAKGLILSALNAQARALGLYRGQGQADACAAVPDLVSAPAEAERDQAVLRRLALWAERYSPLAAADALPPGGEGLMLDMTGGAHLFGGEEALLADIRARLSAAGISSRCAMADTAGAAWALARFSGRDETIIPPGAAREALRPLPVEALRLDPVAVKLLTRLGLRRIGDLYALPRAGLARRFRGEAGLAVVQRLDQAMGAAEEPLAPVRPAPAYRSTRVFLEPLIEMEGIAHQLPSLAEALCADLARDGQGARRVVLTAYRVDGRTTAIEAALSAPSAAPGHLLRLLKERGLEHLDLGFGADALQLSAPLAEPLIVRQGEMQEKAQPGSPEALSDLIDRLEARLGERAVRRPHLVESWLPERAQALRRAGPQAPADPPGDPRPRPVLLLDPPEQVQTLAELPDGVPARFVWRRVSHKVAKAAGPERLSPEWWRKEDRPLGLKSGPPRTRDYYRVEDEAGRRFWLFRDGLYSREDADRPPDWWLHGVFG